MIGEKEGHVLQQLAGIGWAMEEASRRMAADAAEATVRNAAQLILKESVQCMQYVRQMASCKGCTLQLRRLQGDTELRDRPPLAGAAFDRHYLQQMVQWHEQARCIAQDLTAITGDAEVRKFAGQLERQLTRRLSLVTRLLAQLERHLAQQRHYVW